MFSAFRYCTPRRATPHTHPDGKIFAWFTLIACIGEGAFWTVFPLILLRQLQSEQMTSYYQSSIALVLFFASLGSIFFFTRYSRVLITKIILIGSILALGGMTFATNIWHIASLDIPRAIFILLFNIALSLFLSSFYKRTQLGEAEGRFFLFNNVGWLIGPILGGLASKYFGSESVFLIAMTCYAAILALFLHQHFVAKHPDLQHAKGGHDSLPWKHILEFFRNSRLRFVFAASLGLSFWLAMAFLYRAMQLKSLGFGDEVVGFATSASVIPFILLDPRVGRWGDKYGVKRFLLLGFAWLGVSGVMLALTSHISILFFAFMIIAYAGAACIEPLRDTFFYKSVKPADKEKFYGIYNLANPTANICGPLLGAALFIWNGYVGFWLGLGALMLVFAGIMWRIPGKIRVTKKQKTAFRPARVKSPA